MTRILQVTTRRHRNSSPIFRIIVLLLPAGYCSWRAFWFALTWQTNTTGTGTWSSWNHQQLIGDTDSVHDAADSGWSGSQTNARAVVMNTTGECSFVWLVEPRDQVQLQWTGPTNEAKQTAELFGSFLEKGVIRRARLQLLVSQQKVGLPEIQTAYTQLRHRELPLTT